MHVSQEHTYKTYIWYMIGAILLILQAILQDNSAILALTFTKQLWEVKRKGKRTDAASKKKQI